MSDHDQRGATAAPPHRTLVLFASGDFAFNLYWQSVSLYLLFFYIDVLALPPAVAGGVFMVGALWDGIADLAVGAAAERWRASYRRIILWGTVPLGLSFALMFAPPVASAAWLLAAQMVFRTFYAATNVPYSAWTTRLSDSEAVRTVLTGLRMTFGAGAATLVALGLPALAIWAAPTAAIGYPRAAVVLALVATPLLLLVAWRVPEPRRPAPAVATSLRGQFGALVRNRAFVALNVAAALGAAAAALLMQSVPYHFRYVAHDAARGPAMLATMGVASTIAVPVWTAIAARIGVRNAWAAAAVLAIVALGGFGRSPTLAIVAAAIAFAGFNLAAWALLPGSVDWGEAQTGERVEALAFGAFAFVQKAALAGAGLAIGALYGASGFVAGVEQNAAAATAIGWLMVGVPAGLVALSIVAILAYPASPGSVRRA